MNLFDVTQVTWTVTYYFKNTKQYLEMSDQMPIINVLYIVL